MRIYEKIPKPLITPSLSSAPPPPHPLPPHKPNNPMLYYSIVVVATATIVLGLYHVIIVRLCTIQYHRRLQQEARLSRHRQNPEAPNNNPMPPPSRPLSGGGSTVSSFKYKSHEHELECSVCLSVFEEGEEVKRLPMCAHCFHATCIDMWLYSHIHCPLCRATVVEPQPPPTPATV